MENGTTNAPHPEREQSEQSKDALRLGTSVLRDAPCGRSSGWGGVVAVRTAPHPERERSEQSKDALRLGPSVLRDAGFARSSG